MLAGRSRSEAKGLALAFGPGLAAESFRFRMV
jgi:predicted naringenin-chalcone synthase